MKLAGCGASMSKGGVGQVSQCPEYPCFRLVVDYRRKIYKIFLEDYDGYIIPLPRKEIDRLFELVNTLHPRIREAEGEDVDYLARKYLGAEPKEE